MEIIIFYRFLNTYGLVILFHFFWFSIPMLIKEIMCQKRNENLVQENDMYNKIMATISFLSFIHRKYFMSEIIFITILHNKTELILI